MRATTAAERSARTRPPLPPPGFPLSHPCRLSGGKHTPRWLAQLKMSPIPHPPLRAGWCRGRLAKRGCSAVRRHWGYAWGATAGGLLREFSLARSGRRPGEAPTGPRSTP